ncbi:ATP-binding cassette sub-family G member 2 [Thecamonas trahens ATCC 50062]|uniref:ATP-binding cassette sub-family G member 2 n=1 Tax=Thecamonas trahens ATCC 50062 TaxID=461836 RepID=A0A0L0DEX2_THETB|nr:ATP-binding cassette sub-family G member 2 [Thecamonas trahens ATCC 50062]KNC50887.1 ATP-binding cassette sub-family G member 2 [Thecamonas trahens ATCC 50062]|eukprot:XP_013756594.1 ATP-binding cassette sub-family G member 2 [Thecamonas trahens ATCC 50062]
MSLLSFNDIKAWVKVSGAEPGAVSDSAKSIKTILRSVSGTVAAGELTMLMGASGAGKTTLLNVLSSRAAGVSSSGTVRLDGAVYDHDAFMASTAYVTQDATFIDTMTSDDILWFRARLQLPSSLSDEDRRARIDDVLELMDLTAVRGVQIGVPGVTANGLTFAQRKRLNIAASLLINPSVLFVDEPTTGLDARAARTVIEALRRVVETRGIIVFATIHQPSVYVFNLFDTVLLMAAGLIVYSGPTHDMLTYFADMGHTCPRLKNPADFVIELMADASPKNAAAFAAFADSRAALSSSSSSSSSSSTTTPAITSSREASSAPAAPLAVIAPADRASWARQAWELTKRAVKISLRNESAVKSNVAQSVFFGLLLGLLYNLDASQAGALDRAGLLFLTVTNAIFISVQASVFVFMSERSALFRETADGIYGPATYLFCRVLADIPFQFLYQLLFALPLYPLAGLKAEWGTAALFVLIHGVTAVVGSVMGVTVSAFTSEAAVANAIAPLLLMPAMMVSGFLIVPKNIPAWLRWLRFISPLRYGFGALLLAEVEDMTFRCSPSEALSDGSCAINSGEDMLATYQIKEHGFGTVASQISILFVFFVVLLGLALAAIVSTVRRKQAPKS